MIPFDILKSVEINTNVHHIFLLKLTLYASQLTHAYMYSQYSDQQLCVIQPRGFANIQKQCTVPSILSKQIAFYWQLSILWYQQTPKKMLHVYPMWLALELYDMITNCANQMEVSNSLLTTKIQIVKWALAVKFAVLEIL